MTRSRPQRYSEAWLFRKAQLKPRENKHLAKNTETPRLSPRHGRMEPTEGSAQVPSHRQKRWGRDPRTEEPRMQGGDLWDRVSLLPVTPPP